MAFRFVKQSSVSDYERAVRDDFGLVVITVAVTHAHTFP
jgi:hypothetical protein